MELRYSPLEVRADSKAIRGYASVFYDGSPETEYVLWEGAVERIDPQAFDRALKERHDARALYNHNPDNLLGRVSAGTLELSVDRRGLAYRIDYDPQDPDHVKVARKVERKDLTGSSFAFIATREEWSKEDEKEVRTIKDLTLYDVGPVSFPAYEGTRVGFRSATDNHEARASHEQWKLREETEKRMKYQASLTI